MLVPSHHALPRKEDRQLAPNIIRRWRAALIFCFVAAILAGAISLAVAPSYVSSAAFEPGVLSVDRQGNRVLPDSAQNIADLLTHGGCDGYVMDDLGIHPSDRIAFRIEAFARAGEPQQLRQDGMQRVVVTCHSPDPRLSQRVLNSVLDAVNQRFERYASCLRKGMEASLTGNRSAIAEAVESMRVSQRRMRLAEARIGERLTERKRLVLVSSDLEREISILSSKIERVSDGLVDLRARLDNSTSTSQQDEHPGEVSASSRSTPSSLTENLLRDVLLLEELALDRLELGLSVIEKRRDSDANNVLIKRIEQDIQSAKVEKDRYASDVTSVYPESIAKKNRIIGIRESQKAAILPIQIIEAPTLPHDPDSPGWLGISLRTFVFTFLFFSLVIVYPRNWVE